MFHMASPSTSSNEGCEVDQPSSTCSISILARIRKAIETSSAHVEEADETKQVEACSTSKECPYQPLDPFTKFSQSVACQLADMDVSQRSKVIARMWQSLSQEEKHVYFEEYEREKILYEEGGNISKKSTSNLQSKRVTPVVQSKKPVEVKKEKETDTWFSSLLREQLAAPVHSKSSEPSKLQTKSPQLSKYLSSPAMASVSGVSRRSDSQKCSNTHSFNPRKHVEAPVTVDSNLPKFSSTSPHVSQQNRQTAHSQSKSSSEHLNHDTSHQSPSKPSSTTSTQSKTCSQDPSTSSVSSSGTGIQRRKRKTIPWTLTFVALGSPLINRSLESDSERKVHLRAGLGEQRVNLVLTWDEADSEEALINEVFSIYPRLREGGEVEVMHLGHNYDLIAVPPPLTLNSLKARNGKRKIFIRPKKVLISQFGQGQFNPETTEEDLEDNVSRNRSWNKKRLILSWLNRFYGLGHKDNISGQLTEAEQKVHDKVRLGDKLLKIELSAEEADKETVFLEEIYKCFPLYRDCGGIEFGFHYQEHILEILKPPYSLNSLKGRMGQEKIYIKPVTKDVIPHISTLLPTDAQPPVTHVVSGRRKRRGLDPAIVRLELDSDDNVDIEDESAENQSSYVSSSTVPSREVLDRRKALFAPRPQTTEQQCSSAVLDRPQSRSSTRKKGEKTVKIVKSSQASEDRRKAQTMSTACLAEEEQDHEETSQQNVDSSDMCRGSAVQRLLKVLEVSQQGQQQQKEEEFSSYLQNLAAGQSRDQSSSQVHPDFSNSHLLTSSQVHPDFSNSHLLKMLASLQESQSQASTPSAPTHFPSEDLTLNLNKSNSRKRKRTFCWTQSFIALGRCRNSRGIETEEEKIAHQQAGLGEQKVKLELTWHEADDEASLLSHLYIIYPRLMQGGGVEFAHLGVHYQLEKLPRPWTLNSLKARTGKGSVYIRPKDNLIQHCGLSELLKKTDSSSDSSTDEEVNKKSAGVSKLSPEDPLQSQTVCDPKDRVRTWKRKGLMSWTCTFVALADRANLVGLISEQEKEEHRRAGLGERDVKIDLSWTDADSESALLDEIYKIFPKMADVGGVEFSFVPEDGALEVLCPPFTMNSLKVRIGQCKLFLHPLECDLSLEPDTEDMESDSISS